MVLCPVALAVGCRKCPVFAVCPLKSVIGDQPPTDVPPPRAEAAAKAPKSTAKAAAKGKTKPAARSAAGDTKRHSRRRDN